MAAKPISLQKNPELVRELALELNLSDSSAAFVTCKITSFIIGDATMEVRTYKVLPSYGGRPVQWGPNDATYATYPDLLSKIPRGFSRITINGNVICEIRGVTKFDGTTRFDNDSDLNKFHTGLLDINKVKQWQDASKLTVRFQPKYNGKFVIFTLFRLNNQLIIFGGSKNVHVPIAIGNYPLAETSNDDGQLHYRILNHVMRDLRKLTAEQLELMLDRTFTGEYVDGEHIVWVPEPYIAYFGNPVGRDLLPLHVEDDLFPPQGVVPSAACLHGIRRIKNIEGVVIYYINKDTGECLMQKHKTIWYVLLRCWREIISNQGNDFPVKMLLSHCIRKMNARSESFLDMRAEELTHYAALINKFIAWFAFSSYKWRDAHVFNGIGIAKIYHEFMSSSSDLVVESKSLDTNDQAQRGWPGYSFKQLVETRKTCHFICYHLINVSMKQPRVARNLLQLASFGCKVAVIMQGLPGSGKSSMVSVLIEHMQRRDSALTIERFCTDDLFTDGFDPSKLAEHHGTNFTSFCESTAAVKFNENTNLKPWEWCEYAKHARNHGYIVLVLTMTERNIDTLVSRNVHNVPKMHMERMAKKMKPAVPMYYGLFTNYNLPGRTATTPSHVTCKFIGCNIKRDVPEWYESIRSHKKYELVVIGISNNVAGTAIVVTSPIETDAAHAHITLSVVDGYHANDVGAHIDMNNLGDYPLRTIEAYFSVMF